MTFSNHGLKPVAYRPESRAPIRPVPFLLGTRHWSPAVAAGFLGVAILIGVVLAIAFVVAFRS